jgi:hypothetical protein
MIPTMFLLRFPPISWLMAATLLTLSACGRKPEPPFDPAPYQTPGAAAVLRHVLAEARAAQADSKVGIIVLGERLNDATPEFCRQFEDTGITWHRGADMTQVWVGPVARVIEKSSKLQPLQLQVVSATKRDPSSASSPEEVVAAWAFEDRMARRRYLATPGADGAWTIQKLATLEQKPQVVP